MFSRLFRLSELRTKSHESAGLDSVQTIYRLTNKKETFVQRTNLVENLLFSHWKKFDIATITI